MPSAAPSYLSDASVRATIHVMAITGAVAITPAAS
jgi:hypothetical protein